VIANNQNSTITWTGTMGNEPPCLWNWPLSSYTPPCLIFPFLPPVIATHVNYQHSLSVAKQFDGLYQQLSNDNCPIAQGECYTGGGFYDVPVFPGGMLSHNGGACDLMFAPDSSINCSASYPQISTFGASVGTPTGFPGNCPAYFTNGCFSQPGNFPQSVNPNVVGGAASVSTVCTELHFTPACMRVNDPITHYPQNGPPGGITTTYANMWRPAGPKEQIFDLSKSPIDHDNPIITTLPGYATSYGTNQWSRWRRTTNTLRMGIYEVSFKLIDEGGMLSNDEYIIWVFAEDPSDTCVGDYGWGP